MAILSSAARAWMETQLRDVIAALGTTCSIRRLVRDGNGQAIPAATAHLTSVPVTVSPLTGVAEFLAEAPIGVGFEGRIPLYDVPAEVQPSDLLTIADGTTYQIRGIRPFDTHLLLALESWTTPLSST